MNFGDLKGCIIDNISGIEPGSERIDIVLLDGRKFCMYHSQDCCETVSVESVVGDFEDLYGEPLLLAEEVTHTASALDVYDSGTWTFYKLATRKGYVDIRWLGQSNGYYSERVDFEEAT